MKLLKIDAPHFVAGVVVSGYVGVVDAAPIVKYMMRWKESKVRNYCGRKKWSVSVVSSDV